MMHPHASPPALGRVLGTLAAAFTLSLGLGCTGAQRTPARGPADPRTNAPERGDAAALDADLERALRDAPVPADLRIDVECRQRDEYRTVSAFGSGVGIWNRRVQIALDARDLRALLRAFRRAGFTRMPARFGRPDEDEGGGDGARAVLRVSCLVALRLDGHAKQVVQVEPGPRSPELQRLAREILDACERRAAAGRRAADLGDALRQLAAGTLAPETFALVLHHKREGARDPADPSGDGFLLRVEGRRAQAQPFSRADGYGETRVLDLTGAEIAALGARLAGEHAERLPANLYAPHYTDLSVQVLGWKTGVQARAFDGMDPAALGAPQAAFERLYDELERLHERVVCEGRPAR